MALDHKVYEALSEALEPPDHYWGAITDLVREGWAQVWGRHRDSDILDNSNWEVVITYLNDNYTDEEFRVEGSNHWLVGWNDCLMVLALVCGCDEPDFYNEISSERFRCRNCANVGHVTSVFMDMLEFAERVKDYPILNEEKYSEMEYEDMMKWLEQEVGEEDAGKLYSHLYDTYSASRPDDVRYEWIEEWKQNMEMQQHGS